MWKTQQEGKFFSFFLHHMDGRLDGDAGVERVKDGFYEDAIHSAIEESRHLFFVSPSQQMLVKWHAIGGLRRTDAAGGSHAAEYETRFLGCEAREFFRHSPCDATGGEVHLTGAVRHAIVGERDALCVEGAGLYEVGPRLEVFAVDALDDVGSRQAQQVVATLQFPLHILEAVAPKILFPQVMLLYHRPHRPVEDEDSAI